MRRRTTETTAQYGKPKQQENIYDTTRTHTIGKTPADHDHRHRTSTNTESARIQFRLGTLQTTGGN